MHTDYLLRELVALLICGATIAVTGCGGELATAQVANNDAGRARSIGASGVSLQLPAGWDGYTTLIGPDEPTSVIWAASTAISEPSSRPSFPHQTLAKLPHDGIAVEIVPQPAQVRSASPLIIPPMVLADGYFLADGYEGQPAPHVSTQIIEVRIGDRALYVQVFFGRIQPDEAMRSRANRVLASITVAGLQPNETRADGFIRFDDPAVGISGGYPDDWHRARALTNLTSPREVLALATYPLRGGAEAGECAPDKARADMPLGGAFIWLLEYRPLRGEVWAELPRERFPLKPSRFAIRRAELKDESVSCFSGPAYSTTFRAADRPFQLLVAFGGWPRDEQLGQVDLILDGLRFEELPSPPPDPYAGWPSVNDNPGDSLRPPPGWPATAAMFPVDKTPRPRPLFFASNRALSGLPQKLIPYVDELPGPFPARALASFPPDGMLVWALEEEKGGPSAQFPQIGRAWPAREDFEQWDAPLAAQGVRWLRAGGSFRAYRFSVWVATGPEASDSDLALGLKSAESLAVSGCWREGLQDCRDG